LKTAGVDLDHYYLKSDIVRSTTCFRFEISGWRDAALYPLAAPRAAPTDHRSVSRATRSRRLLADFFLA
jgi:hypothetical protein